MISFTPDFMTPRYLFDSPFSICILSSEEFHEFRNDERPGKKFFTDGSKTKQRTGFGIYGDNYTYENFWNYATVFQALEINHCAKEIVKMK